MLSDVQSRVGPYRIVERLGAGGMGIVYLAEDPRLGRRVALKRVSDPALSTPDARSSLLREAAMAATLNHPNIATVYDVLDEDGRPYIVMEYVPGETLSSQLANGPLAIDRVVQIGLQLCDALGEAHAHGVVHRDLKPANIRVTPGGRVKVLDFGLALRPHVAVAGSDASALAEGLSIAGEELAEAHGQTRDQIVGTPIYMAPEVLLGQSADARADIYGLGVTLFELATGRAPFAGHNFVSVAMAVLTEPLPPAADLVPGGLGEIIARAMAREPADRYQTIAHMRRDLVSLSAKRTDMPTDAVRVADLAEAARTSGAASLPSRLITPLAVAHPPRASVRRPRWTVVAAGAAVLIVVLGALTSTLWRGTTAAASGPPVVAVLPLDSSGGANEASLGVGIASALITDLASTRGLTVISRVASLDQMQRAPDIQHLARELGASYVISGGCQVVGERMRISLRLMSPDGAVVAGFPAEGPRDRLFDLQRTLALQVAEFVRGSGLSADDRTRLARRPTTNLDAFDAYSTGRALLEREDVAGNVQKAIDAFERATTIDRNFALAYAGLGEAAWAQYRITRDPAWAARASASTVAARDLDPSSPEVRYTLALVFQGMGKATAALQELRAAVDLQPNYDDAYRLRGEILARLGRWDEAFASLQKAIDVRPNYWGNYRSLGLAYRDAGRLDSAMTAFQRIVDLVPDNAWGYQLLGTIYQQQGRLVDARLQYEASLQHGGTPATLSNLGNLYYTQGDYADALRMFEDAARLRPRSAATQRNIGDTLRRLRRADDARLAYERAAALSEEEIRVNPGDAHAHAAAAVYLGKLGRFDLAEGHLREARAAGPADAEIWYRSAVVRSLRGRPAQAIDDLEKAIAAGYSPELIRSDDDLTPLRREPRFVALMAARSGVKRSFP